MPQTRHPKKYINVDEKLVHASKAADCHAVYVAWQKIKKLQEFCDASPDTQKQLLKAVKVTVLEEHDQRNISGNMKQQDLDHTVTKQTVEAAEIKKKETNLNLQESRKGNEKASFNGVSPFTIYHPKLSRKVTHAK